MSVSLRKAINDKCRDCIFDELSPGRWRQQVSACSVSSCPLWPVRPTTKANTNEDDQDNV